MKEQQREHTFKVLDKIDKVEVSPFFKERVLEKINQEKQNVKVVSWFTPKLQIAAMIVILLVNTAAIFYAFNIEQNTNLDTFAAQFTLTDSEDILFVN